MVGLDCGCCGDIGAVPDRYGMYSDAQPLVCGCPGQVSLDCETHPYVNNFDEPCVACELRKRLAAEVKRRKEAEMCRHCEGNGYFGEPTPIKVVYCPQCDGTGRDRGPREG